jgi:hypothetical protein
MSRNKRALLGERIVRAAEMALAIEESASPIEVFLRIGWLNTGTLKQWRQGRLDCMEDVIQASPPRVAEALEVLRSWADEKGLIPSEIDYVARSPRRESLRFSRNGDPAAERLYRTHWASPEVSAKRRQQAAERERPPELLAIRPLSDAWCCHHCGGSGDFLMMENSGPSCLRCAGLGDLVFLPAGDALLTRRVREQSPRYAVVVRFSKTRRRYERQGLFVEPRALEEARSKLKGRRE